MTIKISTVELREYELVVDLESEISDVMKQMYDADIVSELEGKTVSVVSVDAGYKSDRKNSGTKSNQPDGEKFLNAISQILEFDAKEYFEFAEDDMVIVAKEETPIDKIIPVIENEVLISIVAIEIFGREIVGIGVKK